MKHKISIILFLCLALTSIAQDKALMAKYQQQLTDHFDRVRNAPTDNERYNANELAVQLFAEALQSDNSFKYQWDFGTAVSVLTAPDKKFKIITWPVVSDQGEYECFGFIQVFDEKEDGYVVYQLTDKSDEAINIEESLFSPEYWLGAVYQQLVMTSHDGKNYYTLLGWTGRDNLVQRKVIEPVCFRGSSSKPQFGQPVFRKEKNVRRVVLDYSRNAMVNLNYSEQYTRTVINKRVKKGSRTITVHENSDNKERMIIFDEISAQIPGMEGLFQYYVPTGTEMAYIWNNGRWDLKDNAQGRVPNARLNQDFDTPHQKSSPSYQTIEKAEEQK